MAATREALCGDVHASTGTPRGAGRAGRVADRPVRLKTPGNAGRGKQPDFENIMKRRQGKITGNGLTGSIRVQKLQTPQGGDRRSHRIEARAETVLALVEETPDMTLAEIAAHLENEHGVRVSQSTVWRFFDDAASPSRKTTHASEPQRPDLPCRRRAPSVIRRTYSTPISVLTQ